jgi:hypothetical protein
MPHVGQANVIPLDRGGGGVRSSAATSVGGFTRVTITLLQYRQTVASLLIISAQKGHFFMPSARNRFSMADASGLSSKAWGRAMMNRAAP